MRRVPAPKRDLVAERLIAAEQGLPEPEADAPTAQVLDLVSRMNDGA